MRLRFCKYLTQDGLKGRECALIFNLTNLGSLIQEAISMKVIGLFLVSYLHLSPG